MVVSLLLSIYFPTRRVYRCTSWVWQHFLLECWEPALSNSPTNWALNLFIIAVLQLSTNLLRAHHQQRPHLCWRWLNTENIILATAATVTYKRVSTWRQQLKSEWLGPTCYDKIQTNLNALLFLSSSCGVAPRCWRNGKQILIKYTNIYYFYWVKSSGWITNWNWWSSCCFFPVGWGFIIHHQQERRKGKNKILDLLD